MLHALKKIADMGFLDDQELLLHPSAIKRLVRDSSRNSDKVTLGICGASFEGLVEFLKGSDFVLILLCLCLLLLYRRVRFLELFLQSFNLGIRFSSRACGFQRARPCKLARLHTASFFLLFELVVLLQEKTNLPFQILDKPRMILLVHILIWRRLLHCFLQCFLFLHGLI